jgi:hypothetical protein
MVMLPTLIIAGKNGPAVDEADLGGWLADWLAGMLATDFTDLMRLYCG